jgi:hypothetical protein
MTPDSSGEFITREEFIDGMASTFEQLADEHEEEVTPTGEIGHICRHGGMCDAYRDAAERLRTWGEENGE